MGNLKSGRNHESRTSLERLKRLGSSSNLPADIQDARELCTHSVRAEMIMRLLIAKLLGDAEARKAADAWDLLQAAIRLLSSARLAQLLGSLDLVAIATQTLSEASNDVSLVVALGNCFRLLLQIAERQDAAAIKARLRVSSDKAAAFLGVVIGATIAFTESGQSYELLVANIEVGIRIWNLRISQESEDDDFNRECLVPTMMLLVSPSLTDNSNKSKRKHEDASVDQIYVQGALESLLAKHVLLPSRLTFFRKASPKSRSGSDFCPPTLQSRFATVEEAVKSGELNPMDVPLLLDVALRCTPPRNTRQRLEDRSYNDAMLLALLDCIVSTDKLAVQSALTQMFQSLGQHGAAVPPERLQSLASVYFNNDGQTISSDWNMLKEMLVLDASAFSNTSTPEAVFSARHIFTAITLQHSVKDADKAFIEDAILRPIMHAFARGKKLEAFVNLWHESLESLPSYDSVLTRLVEGVSDLVEGSLTTDYIFSWLQRLRDSSRDFTVAKKELSSVPRYLAVCSVASSLLGGLRSPEARDSVYEEAEELADSMLHLRNDVTKAHPQVCVLLKHVLDLWLPLWLIKQTESMAITQKMQEISSCQIHKAALSRLRKLSGKGLKDTAEKAEALAVAQYLKTATHLLEPYVPGTQAAVAEIINTAHKHEQTQTFFDAVFPEKQSSMESMPDGSTIMNLQSEADQVPEDIQPVVELLDKQSVQDISSTVLVEVGEKLMHDLRPAHHAAIISHFAKLCQKMDAAGQLEWLDELLADSISVTPSRVVLAQALLVSLRREDFADRSGDAMQRSPHVIMRRLLATTVDTSSVVVCHRALKCVALVLRGKPFLTNQYTVESTVATLLDLTSRRNSHLRALYLDVCDAFTALLQQHRSRLSDRLHLLVALLQNMLSAFFHTLETSDGGQKQLEVKHARQTAKLLQLLCEPPRLRSKAQASNLVDEARKAQAHVGQSIQFVLHQFCSEVLGGSPAEGVREALMPGIYAMIEAMEAHDTQSMKVLSAAMNNSERAVLRTIYDEYKSFAKWRGN